MALTMARHQHEPMPDPEEKLCVLVTAVQGSPLLCVGDPTVDKEVIGFFLPSRSHVRPLAH